MLDYVYVGYGGQCTEACVAVDFAYRVAVSVKKDVDSREVESERSCGFDSCGRDVGIHWKKTGFAALGVI